MQVVFVFFAVLAAWLRWVSAAGASAGATDSVMAEFQFLGLAKAGTPAPVAGNNPNSVMNVLDYNIAQPTPLPAVFGGTYCRGGACQYRVMPPLPMATPPPTPFPAPTGNSGKEFCRGLSCVGFQGWPSDAALGGYNFNCAHLYNDILGGLRGHDASRTLLDIRDSVVDLCSKRVGPLEVGACPTYADVTVGAMAQKADATPAGNIADVCTSVYLFTAGARGALIDLKMIESALPPSKQASLLSTKASSLATSLNRFGQGGVGPNSPRGRRWRAWAWQHHRPQNYEQGAEDVPLQPLATPDATPSWVQWGASVWTGRSKSGASDVEELDTGCETSQIPGATPDDLTPRGKPKYRQNAPCVNGVNVVGPNNLKYQIAPGSADGTVPPVEVNGGLFTYCRDQMGEIMMGFAQTAPMIVTMTKDWCGYMASVSSWVGQAQEYGHPDWTFRNCEGMGTFMSFALRDQLNSDEGLGAAQVCKKIFLATGAINRWDDIMGDAWVGQSVRSPPKFSGVGGGAPNPAMEKLMKQVQAYADQLFSKLRGQKEAFDGLNGAKAATRDFDPSSVKVAPPGPPPPDLPDSDDIGVLLTTGTSHLRRWGSAVEH